MAQSLPLDEASYTIIGSSDVVFQIVHTKRSSRPLLSLKKLLPLQVFRGKILKIELNGMANIGETKSVQIRKIGELYGGRAILGRRCFVFFAKKTGICKVALLVVYR